MNQKYPLFPNDCYVANENIFPNIHVEDVNYAYSFRKRESLVAIIKLSNRLRNIEYAISTIKYKMPPSQLQPPSRNLRS